MSRLWLLLALVWVPFVSIFGFASPALADQVGDSYPHMAFHICALTLLVVAVMVVRRLLTEHPSGARSVLLRVLLVTVPFAALGNALELVAAVARFVSDDLVSRRTPDLFESDSGLHALAANVTIPMLMLSMLVSLVLVGTVALGARRPAGSAPTRASSPAARSRHQSRNPSPAAADRPGRRRGR